MSETATAFAIKKWESQSRVAYGLDRLLHRLRKWVKIYPRTQDQELPDYDVAWVTEIEGGPGVELFEAMKTTPALWTHAVPSEVAMVPREALKGLGVSEDVLAFLEENAAAIIKAESSRRLHEERYGGPSITCKR